MPEAEKLVTHTGDKIGYNFSMSADLGSGRMVQVMGVFKVGVAKEEINAEFDKLRSAMDRQQAKSAVPAIEQELEGIKRSIAGMTEDLENAEKRFEGKKLPTNEEHAHNNIKVGLRNLIAKRDATEALLEKTRGEAA